MTTPLYNSLSPKGQARFPWTLACTLAGVSVAYVVFGLVPYLYFAGVEVRRVCVHEPLPPLRMRTVPLSSLPSHWHYCLTPIPLALLHYCLTPIPLALLHYCLTPIPLALLHYCLTPFPLAGPHDDLSRYSRSPKCVVGVPDKGGVLYRPRFHLSLHACPCDRNMRKDDRSQIPRSRCCGNAWCLA